MIMFDKKITNCQTLYLLKRSFIKLYHLIFIEKIIRYLTAVGFNKLNSGNDVFNWCNYGICDVMAGVSFWHVHCTHARAWPSPLVWTEYWIRYLFYENRGYNFFLICTSNKVSCNVSNAIKLWLRSHHKGHIWYITLARFLASCLMHWQKFTVASAIW